jgi:hypothetical protein
MSIDVHPAAPRAALHDFPLTVDEEFDKVGSWAETAITVVAATVTILFVSFVAVLMAMA